MLGAIGDKRAVEPLITALSDHNYFTDPDGWHYYVYLKAADALAEIGDNRAVEPLIAMLREVDLTGCCYFDVDAFSTQQLSATARALGKLRDPRAVEPLLIVLQNVKNHGIGIGAGNKVAFEYVVKALGEIGDPRAIDLLTDFVNVGWTEEAKKALMKIKAPKIGSINKKT